MLNLIVENAQDYPTLDQGVLSHLAQIDSYGLTSGVLAKFEISGVRNFISQVLSHAGYTTDDVTLRAISEAIHSIVKQQQSNSPNLSNS